MCRPFGNMAEWRLSNRQGWLQRRSRRYSARQILMPLTEIETLFLGRPPHSIFSVTSSLGGHLKVCHFMYITFWFVSYALLIFIAYYSCAKWQSVLKQSVLKRLSRNTYVSVGMAARRFADKTSDALSYESLNLTAAVFRDILLRNGSAKGNLWWLILVSTKKQWEEV